MLNPTRRFGWDFFYLFYDLPIMCDETFKYAKSIKLYFPAVVTNLFVSVWYA